MTLTLPEVAQALASGLLMGLMYGLTAAGLALIFGLMNVVNFAHGEFLMTAMYATLGCAVFLALDPLVAAPLVAAAMFVFGAVIYVVVIRFAMRSRANAGMAQIFATFGLAVLMRGLAQYLFTPEYRSITASVTAGRTLDVAGVFLPLPQLLGGAVAVMAFVVLYVVIRFTDFGRALEATREDAGAVALVGIDSTAVFAVGWGLGAALVGLAGALIASFFYIYPDVGASFALIAYVTVALGGFGSVFGAFAGGIVVGLLEAATALVLPPSLKAVGIYAAYLVVVVVRPRGLFGASS